MPKRNCPSLAQERPDRVQNMSQFEEFPADLDPSEYFIVDHVVERHKLGVGASTLALRLGVQREAPATASRTSSSVKTAPVTDPVVEQHALPEILADDGKRAWLLGKQRSDTVTRVKDAAEELATNLNTSIDKGLLHSHDPLQVTAELWFRKLVEDFLRQFESRRGRSNKVMKMASGSSRLIWTLT